MSEQRRHHPALFRRPDSPFWYCHVTDARGKVRDRSTRCRDERAAIARWQQFERAAVGATDPASNLPEASLSEGIGRLIEAKRRAGRAQDTIDFYTEKARYLVGFFGATALLSTIARAVRVDEYIAHREAMGGSQASIFKELVTLRGVLRIAWRRKEIREDWRAVMPIAFASGYTPRETVQTPEQFVAVLDELPRSLAAQQCFAIATSARWKEFRNTRREDVDLEGGFVLLRGTKTKRSRRWVPITPLMRPLLERALRDAEGDDERLFTSYVSPYKTLRAAARRATIALAKAAGKAPKRIGKYGVEEWDEKALEPFRVPYATPNDWRRMYASWMQEAGAADEHIAKAMGHSSTAMVERVYGRARPAALATLMALATKNSSIGKVWAAVAPTQQNGGFPSRETGAILGETHETHETHETAPESSNVAESDGNAGGPHGARTRDRRIKRPHGSTTNTAGSASGLSDWGDSGGEPPTEPPSRRVVTRCGPPSLYGRSPEPRTFGALLDAAARVDQPRRARAKESLPVGAAENAERRGGIGGVSSAGIRAPGQARRPHPSLPGGSATLALEKRTKFEPPNTTASPVATATSSRCRTREVSEQPGGSQEPERARAKQRSARRAKPRNREPP